MPERFSSRIVFLIKPSEHVGLDELAKKDKKVGKKEVDKNERVIAELSRIRALKVISRTSVMPYKNASKSLPDIARALGVKGVVEGSVLRDGGTVRITVQLIEAASDRHLWAESYTRDARNILALQSEVAAAIAREVRVAVSPEEAGRLGAGRPVDPEAHREVLLGTYAMTQSLTQRRQEAPGSRISPRSPILRWSRPPWLRPSASRPARRT